MVHMKSQRLELLELKCLSPLGEGFNLANSEDTDEMLHSKEETSDSKVEY